MSHLPVMNNYGERDLSIVRGQGMFLYDAEGQEYLDFTAGIAVCNLGHAHPDVTTVIQAQANTLLHCSNLFLIPQQVSLAKQLCKLSGLDQAFFCNSGTEANEAAIKLARKFGTQNGSAERYEIVSVPAGFHGRTLGALSVTPKKAYQEGYHPLLPGCVTPDSYEEVLSAITTKTAACIVEVIQGEGGVVPLPTSYLKAIEARCREQGALLIVDEVQTGVGRTGTFFAFEQVEIQPDIVTMAKGLANGIPIGAVLASGRVASVFQPGSHGSTFGGNPMATAVAEKVVDHIATDSFLSHVREVGAYLQQTLATFGYPVDGRGLMWGMEVPDPKEYVRRARESGVLLTTAGNRVRFVPPLIVEPQHIDTMAARLQGIL